MCIVIVVACVVQEASFETHMCMLAVSRIVLWKQPLWGGRKAGLGRRKVDCLQTQGRFQRQLGPTGPQGPKWRWEGQGSILRLGAFIAYGPPSLPYPGSMIMGKGTGPWVSVMWVQGASLCWKCWGPHPAVGVGGGYHQSIPYSHTFCFSHSSIFT